MSFTLALSARFSSCELGDRTVHWASAYPQPDLPDRIATILATVPAGSPASAYANLERLPGHFALVITEAAQTVLVTDLVRSIPLLYTTTGADGGRVGADTVISDDYRRLGALTRDPHGVEQFLNFGFTLGQRTFYAGVEQCLAGMVTVLRPAAVPLRALCHPPLFSPHPIADGDEFGAALMGALDATLERAVGAIGGRQIALPLSGGLDSRLLATWFAAHDVPNVITFSYGQGGGEASISSQIARSLGLEWHYVDYDTPALVAKWNSPVTGRWLDYNFNATSLPHIQDWFALITLLDAGVLAPDAVIFPGHTIVGNFHGEHLLASDPTPLAAVYREFVSYHGSLQNRPEAVATEPSVREVFRDLAAATGFDGSQLAVRNLIEFGNVRERQGKYINNSMRSYEFFGLGWAMPMLDREFVQVWSCATGDRSSRRDWYTQWVNDYYRAVANADADLFSAPPIAAPTLVKETVKKVLTTTGLDAAVERAFMVRASANSHLGLERFLANRSRARFLADLTRGVPLLGQYAQEFVAGTWSAHQLPLP